MKILPEQDTGMSELHSSHLEISIEIKILLPKRSTAAEMAQKIPFLLYFGVRLSRNQISKLWMLSIHVLYNSESWEKVFPHQFTRIWS